MMYTYANIARGGEKGKEVVMEEDMVSLYTLMVGIKTHGPYCHYMNYSLARQGDVSRKSHSIYYHIYSKPNTIYLIQCGIHLSTVLGIGILVWDYMLVHVYENDKWDRL